MTRGRSLLIFFSRYLGRLSRKLDDRFYLAAALVVAALFLIDVKATGFIPGVDEGTYDTLIRYRLSSPAPHPDIVIVDIDERALEMVGKDLGRWPWPRDTLAEGLVTIADQGARAVFANILISDPDKQNPAGDEALQYVAQSYPQIAFSYIRLPQKNDQLSDFSAQRISGAVKKKDAANAPETVALVPPLAPYLQQHMGFSNLHPDKDGIIRNYAYWDENASHWLPSAALIVARQAGEALQPPPTDLGKLNWRNKQAAYRRISFADVYLQAKEGGRIAPDLFKNKIVILGASAPGISTIKPTAASITTDDNEIIATAIDDVMSSTSLRDLPETIPIAVGLIGVFILAWAFRREVATEVLDLGFALGQVSLLAITYLSISYSSVVIDMLVPFNAILAYFTVARTFQAVRQATWQGLERFWDRSKVENSDYLLIILAPQNGRASIAAMKGVRQILRTQMGVESMLFLDSIIEDKSFLAQPISNMLLTLTFIADEIDDTVISEIERSFGAFVMIDRYAVAGLTLDDVRLAIWRAILSEKMLDPTNMKTIPA